jgi:hypothetical protein
MDLVSRKMVYRWDKIIQTNSVLKERVTYSGMVQ